MRTGFVLIAGFRPASTDPIQPKQIRIQSTTGVGQVKGAEENEDRCYSEHARGVRESESPLSSAHQEVTPPA